MKLNQFLEKFKPIRLCLIILLLLGVIQANAQKKIVGYIPTGFGTGSVDFTRITHLMLAFENPNAAGDLSWAGGNDAFVTTAHNNNVKVLVSICGGGASNDPTYQARYTSLMSAANRAGFISKIVAYLNNHNLDGIDLDLEGPAINGNYNDFVIALNNSLPAGKLLTCALSHTNGGDLVSNAAAQTFDFVGVMAYDNFWGQAAHHSTYSFAETSASWWVSNKGVAPGNVILGVPFYGYTGTTGAGDITFGQIVANYGATAAQQDTWNSPAGTIYYNGIPTIRQKSQLVVDQNYGGIMIWQLAQDATGSNALLPNIKEVLDGACTLPAQPGAISGNTSVASGSSQTYSVASVSGATSYTWTLPSGWTGSSSTTSITTTAGSAGGTITVRANNSCGAGPTSSLTVTVTACTVPAQPGAISGSTTVASGSSQTYSIAAVATATSYTWTLPSGWSGSSTTTSITTTAGSAGGTITVRANNSCGAGPTSSLTVTIGTPSSNLALNRPATASSVEPATTFVASNAVDGNGATRWSSDYVDPSWIYVDLGASYTVNRVKITWEAAFATAYQVQISADAASWTTMASVSGNATLVNDHTGLSGTGRYVRIYGTARNSQWGYSIFELEVYGTSGCTLPAQPGTISGNTSVTAGSSQTYSVAAVSGATSYTWSLPSGWSGSSTTASITTTAGSTGGTISVVANNACGTGPARTLAVTVSCSVPAQPGTISGNTSVTAGSSQTYSVAAVSGATSYTWTLPSGWSGSSTTASITTTAGSAGGTISVTANNSCGASVARTLAVSVGCTLPAQPGAISGNTTVTSGSSNTYSIAAVSGATSYTWTLPAGWTGSSTTASITTTAGSAGGTITVGANNSCGAGPTSSLTVTIGTPSSNLALNRPVTASSVEPATTFAASNAVDGNGATRWSSDYVDPSWIYVDLGASYTVNRVKITWEAAFATAYQVQISADAASWTTMASVSGNATLVNDHTGLSGTGRYVRIYGTARNSQWGYSIFELEVYGTSGCTLPAQPGTISGNTSVTAGSSQTYSVAAVSGATSYTWTLPSGWSGSSTTASITTTAGSTGGTISVVANNTCGAGPARTLAVSVNCSVPAQPGTISGSTSVTAGSSQTYSVAAVSGATSYTWTLPSGWSGSSTTASITTTAGSAGGTITVGANNSCGAGPTRSLTVTVGSSTTNLALNRPVNVTSVEPGTTFAGANAVDGNLSTRWSSDYVDPQSIIVDLGAAYSVNRVKVTWEAAYATAYKVQISSDGAIWYDMKSVSNNNTLVNDHTGLSGTGRYVAIYGTARNTVWGYSIFEFEVYGNPAAGGRLAGKDLSQEAVEESDESIELYPNPVESTLFIRTGMFNGGHIKIINMSGQEFISERFEKEEIDVAALPSGFYVLRLSKDKRLAVKKFMKK